MSKNNNIERNKLDYLLTDIMPVEVSELFSFGKFYDYLLSRQSEIDQIVSSIQKQKAKNNKLLFKGNWATLYVRLVVV